MLNAEEAINIEKLVHGGQGLGRSSDGRAVFVWDCLPGEVVKIQPIRQKKDYIIAVASEILRASDERIEPRDVAYLSTSPWQIMSATSENKYKQSILQETLERAHIQLRQPIKWRNEKNQWHYRNKMEYSFFGDEAGLHLALFERGSQRKHIVPGSSLAMPIIDETAQNICATLESHGIRAGQLKTLLLRANQAGVVAASLFVKDESFPDLSLELQECVAGVNIYYSTPKSPASVITKVLFSKGNTNLSDDVLGHSFYYSVDGFFQVNLEMFEQALGDIRSAVSDNDRVIDMYAGVGTIGLSVGATHLIELAKENISLAQQNARDSGASVIQASTEKALDYIKPDTMVIFDPPRSGLHPKVVKAVAERQPHTVVYLSCNPVTQARDIAELQSIYELRDVTGYNFFPRTPHIESLVVLHKK